MKKVFTTGQVAKICKVAPRTVSKWFDSGRLKGYRIPGSQDRRIPREQLIRFLKEHGMPLGELEEEEWHKVLLIGTEKLFNDRIKELLPEDDDFKFDLANSGFEAGIAASNFRPDTIIIDLGLGRAESIQIVSNLRKDEAYATTLIVGLGLMRTPVQLTILMIAVVLLIAQAIAINRLAMLPYPWWATMATAGPT